MRVKVRLLVLVVLLGVIVVACGACGPSSRSRFVGGAASPVPAAPPVSIASPTPSPSPSPPTLYVPPRSSTCLPLDASYAPLLAVFQAGDPSRMSSAPGFTITVAPYSTVASLSAWEAIYPEGSVNRAALLRHERVHAVRQLADASWFASYENDPAFRLNEEELGYREQLSTLVRGGAVVDVDSFVTAMTDPYYAAMISTADARTWILQTVAAVSS